MNRENRLVKNVILYTIGNLGSKVLVMIIVPIYTHYMNPAEIGYYDLIVTLAGLLCPIIMLSIHEGVYRWLLESGQKKDRIIKSGLFIWFCGVLLTALGFVVSGHYIDIQYGSLVFSIIALQSLYNLVLEITRGLKHTVFYSVSGVVYSCIFFISNIVLVCFSKKGLTGIFLSLIVALLGTIIFLYSTQHELHIEIKGTGENIIDKRMIKYSLQLMPNSISWWLTSYADRFMIKLFLGMSMNGIYAIAAKFPSALSMITSIFYSAWQEQAILTYDDENRDEYYSKIFAQYYKALFCIILMAIPLTKVVIHYTMTHEFHSASKYIGFLYLAGVFQAFSAFYGTGYLSTRQTCGAMTTTIVGAVMNVIINALFMPKYGLQIAGFSTFFSYVTVWGLRIFQTRKYFRIYIKWGKFIAIFMLVIAIIVASIKGNGIQNILLFVGAIFVSIIINKKTIKEIVEIMRIRKLKNKGDNMGERV